ncbi:hypothetical protein IFM89_038268 [Coptis chinensis]|uniref:OTU domain-containing protein n=1 Tax=Coptis chinensis TaxID=261450 RepID=A0A835H7U7_9MAGN|nr:hypothetical protein IFM89_038268 [Coptis chinensis]
MVNWVQQVGRGLGMIIVTGRSDLNTSGRTPRFFLECQHSSEYRVHVKKKMVKEITSSKRKRNAGARKCGSRFKIRGVFVPYSKDCWKIEVVFGRHNHSVVVQLEGNSYANRLRVEEKALVADLMKAGMRPKNTVKNLKERFPDNTSTVQTLYNFRKKNKVEVMKAPKESPKKASQNVVAPKNVIALKKAPKNHVAPINTKEKYLPLVHESFRQYVKDFENVSGDGNCGFRAVAVGMGFDKEMGWIQVRQDLVEEIDTWRHDLYDKMWHDDGASKLCTIIDCGIHSFLPLHSSPPSNPKIIGVLCNKDNNHYVNVKLYQNCLFPRPMTSWKDFVFQGGGEWRDWALPRVDAYTEAFRNLQLLTDAGVEPYPIILSNVDDDDDDLM